MIVVAFIAILIIIGLFAYYRQLARGRDGRRKADLATWQNLLEDYVNDEVCYPEGLICGVVQPGTTLSGYVTEVPCDPINNTQFNYLFTYETGAGCRKWYKIYSKLENESDPIIARVGCEGGCGPSNNYNYWVGSANVADVNPLPGEFWPDIPGGPEPTPSPPPGETPSPLPTPSPSPSGSPFPNGSPPPVLPPSEVCMSDGEPVCLFAGCGPGECCGSCCDYNEYRCDKEINKCVYDPLCE